MAAYAIWLSSSRLDITNAYGYWTGRNYTVQCG